MASNTIAFSTESKTWTTRYSFTPTCYATLNDELISFPETNDSKIAWRHDSNDIRNTFYGIQYPTEFTVSSNVNPSISKTFHALSIEGDYNNWGVDFEVGKGEDLESTYLSAGELERRGRTSYSHIPLAENKGTATAHFLGRLQGFFNGINGSGTVGSFSVNVDRIPEAAIPLTPDSRIAAVNGEELFEIPNVRITGINVVSNTVNFSYEGVSAVDLSNALAAYEGEYFYVINPGRLDGNPMKGHYMLVTLTATTDAPIELFAVNTEFVDDPLNSTLG